MKEKPRPAFYRNLILAYRYLNEESKANQVLSEAFFLYSLLEFSQRAGIQPQFKFKEEGGEKMKWIDRALEQYHFMLRDYFRIYWTSQHRCEVEGCMWSFVSDGGMKIHRKLCAAKFSGIRELKHSNVRY